MESPVTLYGIKTCDTMRKARTWLDSHAIAYTFHDYKTQGIAAERLQKWVKQVGWEKLLNKAGTTFRALPDVEKTSLTQARAIEWMLAHPAMIKRPVMEVGERLEVGFKPDAYAAFFKRG